MIKKDEVKSIVKKITDFEYILKRRQLEPTDFLNYMKYMITLDKLRITRVKNMEKESNQNKEKNSLFRNIQAAFIRHISYIFERAVRRFTTNLGLWQDYITFLKYKKSNSILNTVYGRVLSLHPKVEDFWIETSIHEVEINNNTHAARVVLQRGIRVNPKSTKLWLKYFELELWNAIHFTEQQKLSSIEVNTDIVQAAPLVVFKHAMITFSDNIDPLLSMHSLSDAMSPQLSISMEKELKKKFKSEVKLWCYLMSMHTDKILFKNKKSDNSNKRKRHSDESSAIDLITSASLVMDKVSKIISSTTEEHKVTTTNNNSTELLTSAVTSLSKCMGVIGNISLDNINKASSADTKKMRMNKNNNSSEDTVNNNNNYSNDNINLALEKIKVSLSTLDNTFDELYSLSSDQKQCVTTTKECIWIHAKHQINIIASCLNINISYSKEVNTSILSEWVCNNSKYLVKHSEKISLNGLINNETEILISSFCHVSNYCLSMVSKLYKRDDKDGKDVLLLLLSSLQAISPLICASEEGRQLIMKTINIAISIDLNIVVENVLKNIVSSKSYQFINNNNSCNTVKNRWCEIYIKFVSVNYSDMNALKAAYEWILTTIKNKPHYFHSVDLSKILKEIIQALDVYFDYNDFQIISSFLKTVVNKAVINYPNETYFSQVSKKLEGK